MAIDEAFTSLEGLSVGDAFGEEFFYLPPEYLASRTLPPRRWRWTDDTHMALSVVDTLRRHGEIVQDALCERFAKRFARDPWRGYGAGAAKLLQSYGWGEDWRVAAPALFRGGSFGNGAAMRAAPIGGFFAGDPVRAAVQAQLSAVVTHAHPEGQAGAIAVAVAAAIAARQPPPSGQAFLREVTPFIPEGLTKERAEASLDIPKEDHGRAIDELGTGSDITAQDTVPYCLWCAAHHLDDFAEAMWFTVAGHGDRDTTCAIVGGIVALASPVPREWVKCRERLPIRFRRPWRGV